jgi:lysophospholipase L1-like esterase
MNANELCTQTMRRCLMLNKIIFTIVCIACTLYSAPRTVLLVGHSIVVGYGSYLTYWTEDIYDVRNLAVNGYTSTQILGRLNDSIASIDPDVVVLGGTCMNDIDGTPPPISVETYTSNIKSMITAAKAYVPDSNIVYITDTPIDETYTTNRKEDTLALYIAAGLQVAIDSSISTIDLHNAVYNNKKAMGFLSTTDGTHFTESGSGYAIIAQIVADSMYTVLDEIESVSPFNGHLITMLNAPMLQNGGYTSDYTDTTPCFAGALAPSGLLSTMTNTAAGSGYDADSGYYIFDGSDDYINITPDTIPRLITTGFTVILRCRINSYGSDDGIFGSTGGTYNWAMPRANGSDGKMYGRIWNTTAENVMTDPDLLYARFPDSQWVSLAATVNLNSSPQRVDVYYNGVRFSWDNTLVERTTLYNSADVAMQIARYTTHYSELDMKYCAVYDTALPMEIIRGIHENPDDFGLTAIAVSSALFDTASPFTPVIDSLHCITLRDSSSRAKWRPGDSVYVIGLFGGERVLSNDSTLVLQSSTGSVMMTVYDRTHFGDGVSTPDTLMCQTSSDPVSGVFRVRVRAAWGTEYLLSDTPTAHNRGYCKIAGTR